MDTVPAWYYHYMVHTYVLRISVHPASDTVTKVQNTEDEEDAIKKEYRYHEGKKKKEEKEKNLTKRKQIGERIKMVEDEHSKGRQ